MSQVSGSEAIVSDIIVTSGGREYSGSNFTTPSMSIITIPAVPQTPREILLRIYLQWVEGRAK